MARMATANGEHGALEFDLQVVPMHYVCVALAYTGRASTKWLLHTRLVVRLSLCCSWLHLTCPVSKQHHIELGAFELGCSQLQVSCQYCEV